MSERARLMLGTAQWTPGYGIARAATASAPPAAELLRIARERGIVDLDTAPAYGDAEAAVGAVLRATAGHDVRVCTKLPALDEGLAADELVTAVRAAADGSRRRLGVPCLHGYLLHRAADLKRPGLLEALTRLRDEGVVEALGVSIYTPEEAFEVARHPALTRVQLPFSLFDQRMVSSGAVSELRAAGVAIDARSALLQGLLLLPLASAEAQVPGAGAWLERLGALAWHHGLDVPSLVLAFARERSGAQRVVVGVDSVAQLEATAAAFEAKVSAAVLDEAAAAFAQVPAAIRDPRSWAARSRGGP